MGNYSRYFSHTELYHPDDVPPPVAQTELRFLARGVLDPLREANGGPLESTSGYRGVEHNRRVGGASDSQHLYGTADDVRDQTERHSGLELFLMAMRLHPMRVHLPSGNERIVVIGGCGLYYNEDELGKFIHVDSRPRVNGCITTWYFDGSRYVDLPGYVQEILHREGIAFC